MGPMLSQRPSRRAPPRKLALVACMRKLLVILNAMIRNGTKWATKPATA